ncbi:hypothetical protein IPC790_07445 [Pseudomonas aeruginosa]|uniref:type II toxin-antitoxin system RnlB family antitoxin n=1 Tax=Pseudomonas aeruginosa TaxID=287 RepID=UPI000F538C35|nr:type II toxin-antitoxin system RnlB family antitoxin [Pseudomonas aeruginosa]RPV49023.1 hypothetical protein IPC790_07445 [Pseudomonas aeruginosa]
MHFIGEGMINYLLENVKIPSSNVQALVLASNPHSPFESLPEIERSLSQNKVKGKVLFDMLLANGSKQNRFFIVDFDGAHILLQTLSSADSHYEVFSRKSAAVLSRNFEKLNNVLLSGAMKYALMKGLPL